MKWAFLELKFPPGITRTPRAMEEVFNALHALAPSPDAFNWWNLNIKGYVPKNYTLLIIAHDGQLRFFIRFPEDLKEFIKTRFYAQYPEIKFEETDDPLKVLPPVLPNALFDCEIFDARFKKEDAYPMKTYVVTEKLPPEQQLDPITLFSEGATQISNKEWLIFQIIILPTTADNPEIGKKWIERGNKVINQLMGKTEAKEPGLWEEVEEFIINLLLAPFRAPVWKAKTPAPEKEISMEKFTPGERRVIELIQTKLSKLGYWCNWRIVYVGTRDVFKTNLSSVVSLIMGILRNFSTEDLNAFSLIPLTKLKEKETFSLFILKTMHYNDFRGYAWVRLPEEVVKGLKDKTLGGGFILNSEELATLFHPPMEFVPPIGLEKISTKELPPPF